MAEKKSAKKAPAKKPAAKSAKSAKTTKASAVAKKPTVTTIKERAAAAKTKAKGHGGGFMDFIRTQGVVGLAVGLAIGTAAGDTVKKLVTAFIDPLVQLIVGSQEGLQAASFTVEIAGRKGEFLYGAFISSLITLLAVAFVVYAIIHFLKLDKLDKKKD